MQIRKKSNLSTLFVLLSLCAFSQSDRIPLGDKQYQLLNRLDIKLQNDSILSFSTIKPYNRKQITERIEYLDSLIKFWRTTCRSSAVDRYNMRSLLMNNADWTKVLVILSFAQTYMEYFF